MRQSCADVSDSSQGLHAKAVRTYRDDSYGFSRPSCAVAKAFRTKAVRAYRAVAKAFRAKAVRTYPDNSYGFSRQSSAVAKAFRAKAVCAYRAVAKTLGAQALHYRASKPGGRG